MKESDIQTGIVTWMSFVCRRYKFLYFAVPNEALLKLCKSLKIMDKLTYALMAILKKMGLTPGCSDLIIGWNCRMFAMEVKTATGEQSDNQMFFESWCQSCGVPYRVVRSLDEAQQAMIEWGIIGGEK